MGKANATGERDGLREIGLPLARKACNQVRRDREPRNVRACRFDERFEAGDPLLPRRAYRDVSRHSPQYRRAAGLRREVQVRVGQPPGDDPREHALQSLRDALLAPGAVNPVSEYLRSLAEI